jgi:hypothetical protein
MKRFFLLLFAASLVFAAGSASAHIGYTNRNLGTFEVIGTTVIATGYNGVLTSSATSASVTITDQNVTGGSGWADGTDARFGDSHKLKAFRFTLSTPAVVTINVVGLDYVSGPINFSSLEHPGFSLYGGLAHLPPAAGDHDGSALSVAWMNALVGVGNYDGNFNALGDWKIGSDDGVTFDDLTSFDYIGHAVDGTAANYGSIPGIVGDGVADGSVTATFFLPAGEYTLLVGGAKLGGSTTESYGIEASITVVPEPSVLGLTGLAGVLWSLRRRPARL